jgi:hypothetical protein
MADKKLDKKELEELLRLSNLLEKGLSQLDLENLNKSGNAARVLLESLRDDAKDFVRDISGASDAFKRVVEEITNTSKGIKETNKAFNNLAGIADKVLYHQKGISKLKEKEVIKLQEQIKQEKERLKSADNLLKTKQKDLEANLKRTIDEKIALENQSNKTKDTYKAIKKLRAEQVNINKDLAKQIQAQAEINGILTDQDFHYNQLATTLDTINKDLADTDKLLGLGGAAIDGIGTALDKLGLGSLSQKLGLDEAKEKMEDMADSIRLAGGNVDSFSNKFKVLKTGVSSIGKSLIENLKDPSVIISFVVSGIVDAFKSLDEGIGKLASNFGISYNQAAGLSSELNDAANASYLLNVTTQGLTDAFIELNNQFGTFAQVNNEALETFTRLTKEAKLSSEASKELFASSILTGKSVEDTTTEFLGQTVALAANAGIMLNQKQLLEAVKNVSKATLLTLGGQADKLGEAIVKSKLLGVELSKVENIAESLLNFESSIGAELEAELLTGKNLNLERARLAALNGDIATVAEEIAKQTGTAADFTKMNVIQQEALAKAVGMTREDLAKSLMEREAMAKLSDQEGKTAQEKFNNLVKEVGLEEAKKRLGNEQLANMMAGQTIQERFTATIEKLQEVFVSLVEPLMPVVDAFASILKIVGPIAGFMGQIVKGAVELGKYLMPVYGLYKAIQAIQVLQLHTALAKRDVEVFGLTKVKEELAVKEGMNLQEKIQLAYRKSILFFTNAEYRTEVLKNIQKSIGNNLTKIGNLFRKGGLIYDIGAAAMSTIGAIMKSLGSFLGPFAIPIALAAGATIAGVGYKFLKGDDVMSEGGYGKRTLLAPEGAIKLNDKDTVIAGTNLGGGESKSIASPSINLAPLVERMMAVEAVLNQILTTTGNVYLDSTKVGTTQIMGTYRTQ